MLVYASIGITSDPGRGALPSRARLFAVASALETLGLPVHRVGRFAVQVCCPPLSLVTAFGLPAAILPAGVYWPTTEPASLQGFVTCVEIL